MTVKIAQPFALISALILGNLESTYGLTYSAKPAPNREQVIKLIDEQLAALNNIVCTRTVVRAYKKSPAGAAHMTDTIRGAAGQINGIDEDLPVSRNGARSSKTMAGLRGNWSTGEFGAILAETRDSLKKDETRDTAAATTFNGAPAFAFEVRIPQQRSNWNVLVSGKHWLLGYSTAIVVDASASAILQIRREARQLDGNCPLRTIQWEVSYGAVALDGGAIHAPIAGRFETCDRFGAKCRANIMTFADFHRYGSSTAIRFDEPGDQ